MLRFLLLLAACLPIGCAPRQAPKGAQPAGAPIAPAVPAQSTPNATPAGGTDQIAQRVEGAKFSGVPVEIDGKAFVNCEFENCRIVYSGMGPVELNGCKFGTGIQWELQGPALRTAAFLQAMGKASPDAVRQMLGPLASPPPSTPQSEQKGEITTKANTT